MQFFSRYKVHLKLQRGKSSATEPTSVELSDYSSLSSSENDYTETDSESNYFLFSNIRLDFTINVYFWENEKKNYKIFLKNKKTY